MQWQHFFRSETSMQLQGLPQNLHLFEDQPLQTLNVQALITTFWRLGEPLGEERILILVEASVNVGIDGTLEPHGKRIEITFRLQTILYNKVGQLLVDVGHRLTGKLDRR